jgi:hypothetical protein
MMMAAKSQNENNQILLINLQDNSHGIVRGYKTGMG